jgi:hypothetical protein
MKSLLSTILVLGLLGGVGYLAYKRYAGPDKARACDRLATLCGSDLKGALKDCEQKMTEVEKTVGKDAMAKTVSCLNEAGSCARGVGCMVGTGVSALGEFFEGVRRSVQGK